MEGRHLVLAYAAVFVIQGGYVAWTMRRWFALAPQAGEAQKKSPRPL